ncbi:MAG: YjbE family putative metal transport protein [Rhodospirillales bacterium]|nr:YjbE family putative metal transport protein [Rhodospirillales bacterium]
MLEQRATGVLGFVLESLDLNYVIALASIIMIDIVMSGDNAIVIGMAVAGLPADLRKKAVVFGILAATLLRICFALVVVELLAIIGLLLAGGLLLMWVVWSMWREIRQTDAQALKDQMAERFHEQQEERPVTSLRQALTLIVVADVSMSLDNVIAVGGAAQGDRGLLVFGLILSIALIAFAANFIANLLQNHHWIAYLGLGVVLYIALDMIWRGSVSLMGEVGLAGLSLTALAV